MTIYQSVYLLADIWLNGECSTRQSYQEGCPTRDWWDQGIGVAQSIDDYVDLRVAEISSG